MDHKKRQKKENRIPILLLVPFLLSSFMAASVLVKLQDYQQFLSAYDSVVLTPPGNGGAMQVPAEDGAGKKQDASSDGKEDFSVAPMLPDGLPDSDNTEQGAEDGLVENVSEESGGNVVGESSGSVGGASSGNAQQPEKVTISSGGQEWMQNTEIVLVREGLLFPGIQGIYTLEIENSSNFAVSVSMSMKTSDELPFMYRLRNASGSYILGGSNDWLSANVLSGQSTKFFLTAHEATELELEWKWPYQISSAQDTEDTNLGIMPSQQQIVITLEVEQQI